ncbi:MAG: hypothetical protein WCD21_06760 [Streptomyces sp.]
MAQTHAWMFYEVMWRGWAARAQVPYPVPWWAQAAFRRWSDDFDSGTYESREAAFASNALYRYWHMVGVKDHRQESLIGQAGEIEPVYDKYCLSFFFYSPSTGAVRLPQLTDAGAVGQRMEAPHLPVVLTMFRTADGTEFVQRTFGTAIGPRQRDLVVTRPTVGSATGRPRDGWLCAAVTRLPHRLRLPRSTRTPLVHGGHPARLGGGRVSAPGPRHPLLRGRRGPRPASLHRSGHIRPHWVPDGATLPVDDAPNLFGAPFGYRLTHDAGGRKVTVDITRTPARVRYVYPCGPVRAVTAAGRDLTVTGDDVHIPAGTHRFTVTYA